MAFERIIGQQRVKTFLQRALEHQRVSHAYLFVGEKGVGKEAVALEFARGLLCPNGFACTDAACPECTRVARLNHPDLHFVFPAPGKPKEGDLERVVQSVVENPYHRLEPWANPSISIDRIRELRRRASYKSFEGRGRVVVIADCERMTTEAANSLLKILEEPPEKMHLILVSARPNLLLETIVSRCQVVKFEALTVDEIEHALVAHNLADAGQARLVARLSAGSYHRALQLLDEDLAELQKQALDFFRKSVQSQFVQIRFVEELLNAYQRDQKRVRELLEMVASWLRDAMVFRETDGAHAEQLINVAQAEVLKSFTQKFPDADLYQALLEVERALGLMDRNVQVQLILIVLLRRLRNHLRS